MHSQKQTQSTDARRLVEERIKAAPKELKVSIGDADYSIEEMLKHVQEEDTIGQQIVETQLSFLRAVAKGDVYRDDEANASKSALHALQ